LTIKLTLDLKSFYSILHPALLPFDHFWQISFRTGQRFRHILVSWRNIATCSCPSKYYSVFKELQNPRPFNSFVKQQE